MTNRIPIWIDLRNVPFKKRLPYLHCSEEMAAERVLLGKDDPHLQRPGLDAVAVDGKGTLKRAGQAIGKLIVITDAKDQERASRSAGIVVVEATDWRMIPLENLIAARTNRPGTLYALAKSPEEAATFANTLDVGVHGIVLAPQDTQAIFETDRLLRQRFNSSRTPPIVTTPPLAPLPSQSPPSAKSPLPPQQLTPTAPDANSSSVAVEHDPAKGTSSAQPAVLAPFLEPATIVSVENGGVGDRVCVDTTSILRDGEGLLIGSTARSFVLIHAETMESQYVRARPFRVNAGAVHSYLFAPEGKTRYLSELRAGDPVLAVHPDGIHRVLTIGRAKFERRPLLLVTWRSPDGRTSNAMVQNAETIRLVRPDGSALAVTDLKAGDQVLVHSEESSRHAGMPVDAQAEER